MKTPVPFTSLISLLRSRPTPAAPPLACHPAGSPLSTSQWAQLCLGFHPDPLQTQVLDSPQHRLILLCARQFGKSTLAAIKALHFALSHPRATILCVSPTLRRSAEWLRLVKDFYSIWTSRQSPNLPNPSSPPAHCSCPSAPHIAAAPPTSPSESAPPQPNRSTRRGLLTLAASPAPHNTAAQPHLSSRAAPASPAHPCSLALPNHSRILALPGTSHSNRGYSAHLLLFEEAAFIPDPVFSALAPSVAATAGAIWLISSAGPPSGFFYEIWTHPDLPYTRIQASAEQCPRISREHLAEARLALGELRFRREYLCEFSPDAIPIFSAELLESSLDNSFDPWLLEDAA